MMKNIMDFAAGSIAFWAVGFGLMFGTSSTGWFGTSGFFLWAALAGALVLGPRLGKYTKEGKIRPILGHNMPLAALGVFILWLGWFGFNSGSTTAANKDIALIFVNTNLAAAAGCVLAMATSWVKFGKPEIGMSLNGALAGLVAITSPCATVTPLSALMIGAAAGVLVVLSVLFFERLRVDDPVGAISVHAVNGAWGTLAAGLFHVNGLDWGQVGVQALEVLACFLWVFPTAFVLFKVIARTVGLRVSAEEELEGLDISEHAGVAYPDFEVLSHGGGITTAPAGVGVAAEPPLSAALAPVKQT